MKQYQFKVSGNTADALKKVKELDDKLVKIDNKTVTVKIEADTSGIDKAIKSILGSKIGDKAKYEMTKGLYDSKLKEVGDLPDPKKIKSDLNKLGKEFIKISKEMDNPNISAKRYDELDALYESSISKAEKLRKQLGKTLNASDIYKSLDDDVKKYFENDLNFQWKLDGSDIKVDDAVSELAKLKAEVDDISKLMSDSEGIKISVDGDKALATVNEIKSAIQSIPDHKTIEVKIRNYDDVENLKDEYGKDIVAYRGVHGVYGGGVSSSGIGTFFTSKKEMAETYADNITSGNKLYSASLKMKNPLEIDAQGANWDQIKYLGNYSDEASIKIHELDDEIQSLQSRIEKSKSPDEINELTKQLDTAKKSFAEISDDESNPYGVHKTKWYAEQAKKLGFDGTIFKNVIDHNGGPDIIGDVFVPFYESQISNLETEWGKSVDWKKSGEIEENITYTKDALDDMAESAKKATEERKKLADTDIGKTSIEDIARESDALSKVADEAQTSAIAKEGFANANQTVGASATDSSKKLKEESDALKDVAKETEKTTEKSKESTKQSEAENKAKQKQKEAEKVIKQLQKQAGNAKKRTYDSEDLTDIINQYENVSKGLKNKKDLDSQARKALKAGIKPVSDELKKIQGAGNEKYTAEYLDQVSKEVEKVDKLKTARKFSRFAEGYATANQTIRDSNNDLNKYSETSVSKLRNNIEKYMRNNTAMDASYRAQLQGIYDTASNGLSVSGVRELGNQFRTLQDSISAAGQTGKSFWGTFTDRIKNGSAQFLATYFGLQDVIRYAQQAVQAINEVDTALIELKKVSNASDFEMADALKVSESTAKDLGATVSDTVSATADWARLGYNLPDAEELGRVATLYKNVGDGIDINQANESLISTLQGFQMEAGDSMEIVDKFNEVANNFPIDSGGIGEALQRSAASFNAAHTDLSKSIALVTTTNAVVQDPDVVGTMWKTVSARLRGAKTE